MENPRARKFDAVVLGAGNGGMSGATQLELSGKNVLLLEQHNILGGFSTSFVRGRFEFKASLHEICDYCKEDDPGSVGVIFRNLDVELEWASVPEAYFGSVRNF